MKADASLEPQAILWILLATVVPVSAQVPYWFGLVIISTVSSEERSMGWLVVNGWL